jgi:hypothetical protein
MGLLSSVPEISKFQNLSQVLHGCCAEVLCSSHSRDQLYRKPMRECWSLNTSQEFHGDLPVPSARMKELVIAEACLWEARQKEADKYRSLESRLEA